MTDPRTTRQWRRLAAWIIDRDHGVCWICGHPGADTADHLVPYALDPTRALDPTNLRAAHGARHPDLGCPGQYGRTPHRSSSTEPPTPRPSRSW